MGKLSDPFLPFAEAIAQRLLGQPSYRTPRELRWGRKGSLSVTIGGHGAGRFQDFESGKHGDLIDLVRTTTQLDLAGAVEWLRDVTGASASDGGTARKIAPVPDPQAWSDKAQFIWERTVPLAGTLAESYLHSRKCYVPDASDLRFSDGGGNHLPAMVARVTAFRTGEPLTLHFTRIDPQTRRKADRPDAKCFLSGHRSRGGVVRLSRVMAVGGHLGVAEGIETGLSVIASDRGPVWATLGTGNMMSLVPSSKYGDLIIWADNGQVGEKAARHLSESWMDAGHVVRIARPEPPFGDWNDVVVADAREDCK